MKKTYIAPHAEAVKLNTTLMLTGSIKVSSESADNNSALGFRSHFDEIEFTEDND